MRHRASPPAPETLRPGMPNAPQWTGSTGCRRERRSTALRGAGRDNRASQGRVLQGERQAAGSTTPRHVALCIEGPANGLRPGDGLMTHLH